MNRKPFFLIIAAAILALVPALLLFDEPGSSGAPRIAHAVATTRYVAMSGSDSGPCSNLGSPCRTIQYAHDHSATGDAILVATGTYTETNVRPRNDITSTGSVTQVVYITRSLTIIGGYTTTNWTTAYPLTQPTTIDAQNQGRGVYFSGAETELQNVRITSGNAAGMGGLTSGEDAGGGVYVYGSSVGISGTVILSNTAAAGGGLYIHSNSICSICMGNSIISNTATISGGGVYIKGSGSTVMSSNVISANSAITAGGGIMLEDSSSALQQNTIQGNTSVEGGGLYMLNGIANIQYNSFISNTAFGPFEGQGGGARLRSASGSMIGNDFERNTSGNGGGVSAFGFSGMSFDANTFFLNHAYYSGGGLFHFGNFTMTRNLFYGNSASDGGGVYSFPGNSIYINNVLVFNESTAGLGSGAKLAGNTGNTIRMSHTTISGNFGGDGSGVYVDNALGNPTVWLTNTILVSHTVGITATSGTTATLNGVLWYGNTANTGGAGIINVSNQYTGTPAFAVDFYHLTVASQAIDRGVNAGVTIDIDGFSRPLNLAPDLGADELFVRRLYLPLILK